MHIRMLKSFGNNNYEFILYVKLIPEHVPCMKRVYKDN